MLSRVRSTPLTSCSNMEPPSCCSVAAHTHTGAGDDEESWACGLTPNLFWEHCERLLAAGPDGVRSAAVELVLAATPQKARFLHRRVHQRRAAAEAGGGGGVAHALASCADEQRQLASHCLPPQGCCGEVAALGVAPQQLGHGLHLLGGTRLALGDGEAAAAPLVWRHADAVLFCGPALPPSLEGEWCAGRLDAEAGQVVAAAGDALQAQALRAATPGAAQQLPPHQQPPLQRLLWLGVQDSKHHRSSLREQLDAALAFVSGHLAAGHTVVIADEDGHDTPVCIAVATLLACFASSGAAAGDAPAFLAAWDPCASPPCACAGACGCSAATAAAAAEASPTGAPQPLSLPVEAVSKQSVRQRLAWVSGCYPPARPTRGMLKQVFNFFEGRRRGAAAAGW